MAAFLPLNQWVGWGDELAGGGPGLGQKSTLTSKQLASSWFHSHTHPGVRQVPGWWFHLLSRGGSEGIRSSACAGGAMSESALFIGGLGQFSTLRTCVSAGRWALRRLGVLAGSLGTFGQSAVPPQRGGKGWFL